MNFETNYNPIAMSIKGAAAYLGVGRTTIYALLNTGALESIRVGRRRLVLTRSMAMLVTDSRVPQQIDVCSA
jgi:excisionase family DNA binding protein